MTGQHRKAIVSHKLKKAGRLRWVIGASLAAVTPWTGAHAKPLEVLPTDSNKVAVYIVRASSLFNAANGSGFYIDGTKIASIGNGGCTALYAGPGDHKLEQGWDLFFLSDKQIAMPVHWDAGNSYYYVLDMDGSFGSTGTLLTVTKRSHLREFTPSDESWREKCHYSPAINQEKVLPSGISSGPAESSSPSPNAN